jgi:hypothetical protein
LSRRAVGELLSAPNDDSWIEKVEPMPSGERRQPAELLAEFREKQAAFERQLWERWSAAFDLYDYVLMEARQAAGFFVKHYRAEAAQHLDMLFEAQTRLQARAYRTAWEIRALLVSGNPDGALSRWRTLYEVLIVMLFIEKHGADTADRYLKYDTIQTAKTAGQYELYREKLGHEPLAVGQAEAIQQERDELIKEWAAPDREDNAWAAKALGVTNPGHRVGFGRLERDLGLDRLRLYYNVASEQIHANVKGLKEHPWADMMPSMQQLSLAGYEGMARLADCTNILIKLRPTPDTQRLTHELDRLVQAGARVFEEIERQLEREANDLAGENS